MFRPRPAAHAGEPPVDPLKVWITGAAGMLGHAFGRLLERLEIEVVCTGREVDITDAVAVRAFAANERPTHIINCAAYTSVDHAESDEAGAFAVNAAGAGNIACAARDAGAVLVHFSTDYVFSGGAGVPWGEDDPCAPLGAYARTKREGERKVLEAFGPAGSRGPASDPAGGGVRSGLAGERPSDAYIVRTSWLFGEDADNFVTTMLRLMRERDVIHAVADQHGRPTYTRDLARAVLVMCGIPARPEASEGPVKGSAKAVALRSGTGAAAGVHSPSKGGIYHFANAGATTWHGFASEILRQAVAIGLEPRTRRILPIGTSDSRRAAPRPAYSVLATDRIEGVLGEPPRPWQSALADYLESVANESTPT